MSKISTYPSAETPLLLSDRLIGTEAVRTPPTLTPLATKNFSLGELLQLFSSNFPAASLQAVLNTGNTATQNITLTGYIDVTLIKPDNIEDTSGSQGTTFQFLSKGASSINWVNLPVDNLQAVLNSGNTATQSITLIGNITSTRIIPGNIQDDTAGIGTTGQFLSKTASGIRWVNAPTSTTPGLADVLSVGNTADNNIKLIGLEKYLTVISADNETGAVKISTDSSGLPYIQLGLSSNENTATFRADNINTNSVYQLPNSSGTMALTSDIPAQGLTSVGLTMPLAFNVANSPLISNGTLAVTALGTASQYIRGDGQLAAFPSTGGGGSSVNYYLNGSIPSSVVGYQQMDNDAIIGPGTNFALTGNGLIAQFLTDIGNPNRIEIPGGAWNFEMWFNISSSGGAAKFYVDLLKYDGSTFTLISTGVTNPENITGGTSVDLYLTSLAVPTTTLLATDRLAVRVYIVGNSGGRTATLHTEDNNLCEILTTFSGGVTSLNGLTANTQYLAVGTSGTDFNIFSLNDTHTFNIPNVGLGVSRGLITDVVQSIYGAKTFISDLRVNTLTIGKGGGNRAENTAVGFQTLFSNTTGNNNTANGYQALFSNINGIDNTANGYQALFSNITGSNNTAIGRDSLHLNTAGSNNSATGVKALYSNTGGIGNVADGNLSLYSNTTGVGNTANGTQSLYSNTTAGDNTASGAQSLYFNTIGYNNVAIGRGALYENVSGSLNVAIGSGALRNSNNNFNIGIGSVIDVANPSDTNSIIIGSNLIGLGSNTTVIGTAATTLTRLRGEVQGGSFVKDGGTSSQILMADGSIVIASSNISITGGLISANFPDASVTVRGVVSINDQSFSGLKNFTDNITVNTIRIWRGSNNTATNIGIGLSTLLDTTGNQNTVIGYQAASALLSSSSFTTAVGHQSLKNVLGNNNTAIGNLSGLLLTSGSQNTFIGSQAGGVVGQLVNAANSIAIGYQAFTTKSNQVVIGNATITETVLNGLVLAPLTTNTLIDADSTNKSLVTKEYVNNRLVVERTTGYTLTNADSGGIIIFKTTAAQTLNIPLGLADGFECTFVTLAGITLTVPSVVGITLNNAVGTTMAGGLSFTLKRMLATNTFIVTGNL